MILDLMLPSDAKSKIINQERTRAQFDRVGKKPLARA